MASSISICNMALSRIGVDEFIASIDEPKNNRERDCALLYQPVLDSMLEDFPELRPDSAGAGAGGGNAPPGWGYQYRMPADCARAQVVTDANGYRLPLNTGGTCSDIWNYALCPIPQMPFSVMADTPSTRAIVTDVRGAYLWYTQRVTDPNQFSGLFVSAFAWRLAAELALSLRASPQLRRTPVCNSSGRCRRRRRRRSTRSSRMRAAVAGDVGEAVMDGLQASSPRIMVICHTAKRFTISLYRLLKAARFTAIVGSTSPHTQRLENMLLTLIYRACTKVMQRVAVCHAWLQRINNKSSINIFKCIALHLSVPVFHLNYLLFKFVHPIGQRRLLLDAGKIRDKSLRKLFLDSIDCGHNFKVVGHSMSALINSRSILALWTAATISLYMALALNSLTPASPEPLLPM